MDSTGKRVEVAVLIGLQGSGKSSFYRAHLASTHAHVSKDLMGGRGSKSARQAREIAEHLAQGRSVAVDNTNPSPEDRAPLLALARTAGARTAGYYFDASLAECLTRNARRQGKARVPPVALHATARRLKPPSPAEGFDALYRVRLGEDGFRVEAWNRWASGAT